MCRKTASKCDLAEYCNGAMADCPPDVYKQDGIPCDTSASCYAGQCLGLQRQCVALFGKDANVAPRRCFEEVNMRGDRSGNCGEEGMKFKKCKIQDVFCGRLQCTKVDTIPRLPTRQAVLQTPVENVMCWGTEFHLSLAYDLGAVRDGTPCDVGKICLNGSCVTLEVLQYDCDSNRCHLRGVCNNRRNCHCAYGWAPPFCEGKGYGGSVDSGPPPVYKRNLAVIFAVVTLVGGILSAFLVISIMKREQLKGWLAKSYKEREPSDSESEPEDTTEATSEPEPPPEPQDTLPVKRTQSRLLPAKHTSQPEPRQRSQHTLQPESRPQPLYTPQPELRPQPQRTLQPEPRPQPQRTLEPEPRPQPQRTLQPEPRPQPQHAIQPELRPQPQRTPQPEPRPQPQRTLQPESRPQPQRTLQPESRSQSQRTLVQESRPQSQHTLQPESRPQPQRTLQPEARPQREPRPQPQRALQPEPRPQPQHTPQPEPGLQPTLTGLALRRAAPPGRPASGLWAASWGLRARRKFTGNLLCRAWGLLAPS
ncbi:disintegrin and metalloproteinase domain-containing protein 30-like [Sphaerodactylus townsendi]|uniref:disintegrin and metalloproteinase domain-containing protein 30-like n=1 Tax=Sphaerodactylus townsendi TaxID=933632 RepID=UPI0020263697|nr:disintegrin and metalloproteinase domain-containing protein 30-like [Sphaerodactylus townsendi]